MQPSVVRSGLHPLLTACCTPPGAGQLRGAADGSTKMRMSLRRLKASASQRRLIFAFKVGIATALTTLLTLVDDAYALNELGAWATITVVITMQPTLGSTTNKAIQRCVGTVFAAAVAALVGVSARELLPWPEAGKVLVGLAVGCVTVLLNWLSTSPEYAAWQYALFLSYLTFDFLVLRAYRETPAASLSRVVMIALGAALAALVMFLPPQLLAYEQTASHLEGLLRDCADAVRAVTHTFASGRTLRRLASIDCKRSTDDDAHSRRPHTLE